jgi:hypothetical protein
MITVDSSSTDHVEIHVVPPHRRRPLTVADLDAAGTSWLVAQTDG